MAVGDEQAWFLPGDDDAGDGGVEDEVGAASWPGFAFGTGFEGAVDGGCLEPGVGGGRLDGRSTTGEASNEAT